MERREIVDGYLEVLGLTPAEPTAGLLAQIVRRHVATFPFSSIGPRLGDPLPLDLPSVFDRIVQRRRGGYCFEQNGLLFEVLHELGYSVTLVLARVIHDPDRHPPLTHRITLVDLDGERYVVDVGFGPGGPPVPVPLRAGSDTTSLFRIDEPRPGVFHMQSRKDGDFVSLYMFELVRYGPADCEVGHFYSHRHPEATFVNNLVASRILDDEVRSLRNREYWVLRDAGAEQREITDADALAEVLRVELGLNVTEQEAQRLYAELPIPSPET